MHSNNFVIDKVGFEKALVEFEVNAVSNISESTPSPASMQIPTISEQEGRSQPIQTTLPLPEQAPKTTHLLAMAAIVVASIIAAGIFELKYPEYFMSAFGSSQQGSNVQIVYHPGEILKWVAIGSALVMALPWIIDAARKLLENRVKKRQIPSHGTAAWIYKNLAYIRDKHLAAHLMVKAQGGQTKDEMAERMRMDEVFYNRVRYFQTSLSTEFEKILSSIYKVSSACIWERKGLLISAIVQSKAAVGAIGRMR